MGGMGDEDLVRMKIKVKWRGNDGGGKDTKQRRWREENTQDKEKYKRILEEISEDQNIIMTSQER